MNRATFRLVLLISCAHAMVHVYELALPSVEQQIADEFEVKEKTTGRLGTVWRIPFGVGALLAGWLTDRVGSKRMLLIYIFGCVVTSLLTWWAPSLGILFGTMFVMGSFASIYHPAGLSIISRETTAESRSAALGWHGIFGSLGIASAPFLAGLLLSIPGFGWRHYYLILMAPGLVLFLVILFRLKEHHPSGELPSVSSSTNGASREKLFGRHYLVLVTIGTLSGFIYAALMNFLPRYLTEAGIAPDSMAGKEKQFGALAAAVVLVCGAFGQGLAGRLARPRRLNGMLIAVMLANVPCLLAMAVAEGYARLAAACLMGVVHFMNQPIYNSLIAHYVPLSRRSFGYGVSNMMCFGLGALGPSTAGLVKNFQQQPGSSLPDFVDATFIIYGGLSLVALIASGIALVLMGMKPPDRL